MTTPLRPLPALLTALLLVCTALPAAAQQPGSLLRTHPMAPLLRASEGAPPALGIRSYRVDVLESENPISYAMAYKAIHRYRDGRISEAACEYGEHNSSTSWCNRRTYDYGPGNTITRTGWRWDQGNWLPEYRYTEETDANGLPVSSLREDYDAEQGAWERRRREVVVFEQGVFATATSETWEEGEWVLYKRLLFEEQDGALTNTEQRWNGTEWANDVRTSLPGYTLDQMAEYSLAIDFDGLELTPDRDVALFAHALEMTMQAWDGTGWIDAMRTRITTSTTSTRVAVTEQWDGDAWVPESRATLTFDGSRTTSIAFESYRDDAWQAESKTTYTYDANGNVALVEHFGGEGGAFDTIAAERTAIEWGDITTSVEGDEAVRLASLTAVQPSPATGAAEVHFALAQPGPVMLRLFDVLGREVSTLAAGVHAAGAHAAQLDAASLPAGLYFVRLEAGGVSETRSLVVAR